VKAAGRPGAARSPGGGSGNRFERVYAVVRKIPRGRVATYGQIAMLAGLPGRARFVGFALAALPEGRHGVAWQRVVNAQGRVSLRGDGSGFDELQRVLLRREGVRFGRSGAIRLAIFQWRPRTAGR
jgi:methylated-DNA-protein-cysteine methyltransferase related protein